MNRARMRISVTVLCVSLLASIAYGAEVTFRVIDEATGNVTPVMACITNVPTGKVHLPGDGRELDKPSRVDTFVRGVRWESDRNWIGPVRKMAGRSDNDDRAWVYELRPSLPYWSEPVMFQVSGEFSIELPEGRWRLSLEHGNEYVPVVEEIDVASDKAATHEFTMKRWINMPKLGWYSGDVHVHHPIQEEAHREYLLHYARAEDLHVVNVLEMGDHKGTEFKQLGFGKEFRVQRGDYCLVAGQEEPRSNYGHIIGLNMSALARDVETYDLYDLAFKRIKEQKGTLVGFAHFAWNGCALPRGFPWYVTTENLDFVELMQFGLINHLDYYDYLNLGFRLTAAAGSDLPWGSTMGEVRTFVYTGEKFDIDAWFGNLKKGHSFVSNGPVVEFKVDGQLPGSELKRKSGDKVRITARAVGHAKIGLPKHLTIVNNDGVITEIANPDHQQEITANITLDLTESQWIAAAVTCENEALAHTTPVYVVVDGQPTWSKKRAPLVIQKQLVEIAKIEAEWANTADKTGQAILERLERAKKYYANMRKRIAASDN